MAFQQEYLLLSDEELVVLFHNGERHGSFTVIVERYQKRIYYAASRMLDGDHDEADEVSQDTFVKAYEALGSFRGDAKLYTWLYRIMMNAVIQRSRKKKSRKTVGLESIENTVETGELSAHDRLEQRETTRIIEKAIETLPKKQREVFLMRFYDELPYEEIAKLTGTSVGGLKANYFHAVKKIGEFLHQYGKIAPEFLASFEHPND
jgi:RNA polymerase sigma-70 factor, ECF subfamily